jgi:lysophospholipase L1-like esterase
MRAKKHARAVTIGVVISALSAGAIGWAFARVPLRLVGRVVGIEAAMGLRVRSGLAAAALLGRRGLVMLGDSRFESLGIDWLQADDRMVVPAALAGATARGWNDALRCASFAATPTTLVVWLGVNDMVNERASGAETLRRLQAIVACAQQGAANRVLLLEQIPVRLSPAVENARIEQELRAINAGLDELAQRSDRVELLPLWSRFGGDGATAACADCYDDGLHLNARGEAFLRGLLTTLLGQP